MAASAVAFSRFGPGDGYAALLPAMALYGVGVGLAYPAVTALMLTSMGSERAGLAAGALFMVELVVGGLATAVATTVVTSAGRFSLRPRGRVPQRRRARRGGSVPRRTALTWTPAGACGPASRGAVALVQHIR
jgi:hypothetical protein